MKKHNILKLILSFIVLLTMLFLLESVAAPSVTAGKSIVDKNCAGCHVAGVMDAPKIGDKSEWLKRNKQGTQVLIDHALNGFNNMPAKGGNMALGENDIVDAVAYLLDSAGVKTDLSKFKAKPNRTVVIKEKKTQTKKAPDKNKPAKAAITKSVRKSSNVNKFNRLMKSKDEWNPPPAEDGIHDPDNEGTYALQAPKESFKEMTSSPFGNHVDWVKSLNKGEINPRFDRLDDTKKPFVLDLNIVRE